VTFQKLQQVRLNPNPPLRDQTYDVLKDAILSGVLKPGDRLVEQQVADSLGLSRIPVREAFRRLQQEGYLVSTKSGLVVRQVSLQELHDLYAVRARLEGMAAGLAAERASEEEITGLWEILTRMENLLEEGDETKLTQASFEFHSHLYSLLRNRFLIDFLNTLQEQLRRYRSLQFKIPHRGRVSVEEDRCILEAIARHDSDAADRYAQQHIKHLWEHAEALAREGSGDTPGAETPSS
jgi:DNA-binding GntR family transcriptional regulator